MDDLIDDILTRYHEPFTGRSAELEALFDAAGWQAARSALDELRSELVAHMEKEELVLFPWLRVRADTAAAPIRVMQMEHDDSLALLATLQAAVDAAHAVAPSPAAYAAHAMFAEWIRDHIAMEDDQLFPQALGLARAS